MNVPELVKYLETNTNNITLYYNNKKTRQHNAVELILAVL